MYVISNTHFEINAKTCTSLLLFKPHLKYQVANLKYYKHTHAHKTNPIQDNATYNQSNLFLNLINSMKPRAYDNSKVFIYFIYIQTVPGEI